MADRVFIVDDHPVVRRGFASLVERQSSMQVCGEAGAGAEAIDRISGADPDLVLVDVAMDGMSGIELIKRLAARYEELRVLVISMHDESLYAERSLQAGALGYVMKGARDEVIVEAMETVLDGKIFLSPEMNTRALLARVGRDGEDGRSELGRLTDRELEVFEELGRGRTTREIAEALHISPRTVGSHLGNLREKLTVETTARLRVKAILWYHDRES